MTTIKAIVKNRQISIPVPAEWPEGCEVRIEPIQSRPELGMKEEDWPTTPEGIAALLQRWDQHQPLEMTDEEISRWQEELRRQKDLEKAAFAKDAERLRNLGE